MASGMGYGKLELTRAQQMEPSLPVYVEALIVPAAATLGVGFVPHSPLGRGQLTGQANGAGQTVGDVRQQMSRFQA